MSGHGLKAHNQTAMMTATDTAVLQGAIVRSQTGHFAVEQQLFMNSRLGDFTAGPSNAAPAVMHLFAESRSLSFNMQDTIFLVLQPTYAHTSLHINMQIILCRWQICIILCRWHCDVLDAWLLWWPRNSGMRFPRDTDLTLADVTASCLKHDSAGILGDQTHDMIFCHLT